MTATRTGTPTRTGTAPLAAVLVCVALATLVTAIDNSVVVVALPALAADLHASLAGMEWVSAGYVLAFGTLLLAGGTLADRYGRRVVLASGLVGFALASVAAGLAPGLASLVAARVLQGVFAALVVPASLALVADLGERRRAIGAAVWSASVAVAVALGPLVGGVVSQAVSWRWLFLGNVPVVVVALLALRRIPIDVRPRDAGRVDVAGLVLFAATTAGATTALIAAAHGEFVTAGVIIPAGLAVLAAVAFSRRLRVPSPVIDPALFANRVFAGGTLTQLLWGAAVGGTFFFTALVLRGPLQLSPVATGAMFLPIAAALVLSVPVGTVLAARYGTRPVVAVGLVVVAAGMLAALVVVRTDVGLATLAVPLVAVGIGSGLTTPIVDRVLAEVEPRRAGAAAAVTGAARELATGLGIAGFGVVVAAGPHLLAGFRTGLAAAAAVLLVAAVVVVRTQPSRQPVR